MLRTPGKWIAAALLAVAACDESPVTLPDASEPASIASSAAEMRLVVGGSATVSGQVLDQNGNVVRGAQAVFTSDNPVVATVDQSGSVRAVSAGSANVTAAYGKVSATTRVTVTRNESGFVRTVDVQDDSLVTDITGPLAELVVRSFTVGGAPVCPALTIKTSDASVAVVTQGLNPCRLNVRGTFPGRATVTVSAEGVSDSVRVIVTNLASRADFVEPVRQLLAGTTVPYTVRVTGGAGPVAGRTVNFDVTRGSLSARTVVTDANGDATVLYTPPTNLAAAGGDQLISFGTTLLNGSSRIGSVEVKVVAGALVSLQLYRQNRTTFRYELIGDVASITAPLNQETLIGAVGWDRFGNTRGIAFGASTPTQDNIDFEVSPASARTCTEGSSYDVSGRDVLYTCTRATTASTVRVTAKAGDVSRHVDIVFGAS